MARDVSSELAEENKPPPLWRALLGSGHARGRERSVRDSNRHYRFLKWIVLSISVIFVIFGSLGVGATLWALSRTGFLLAVKSSSVGVYTSIVAIVLIFITGVVGFVGVLRHNLHVLGSHTVLLLVTFIFSLVGGILTYITATRTDQMSLQRVAHIVRHDYGKDSSKTAILDIVQQSFQCCGSESFISWASSFYGLNQTDPGSPDTFTVPKSCCVDPSSQICQSQRHSVSSATNNQFIYIKGCVQKLQASSVPYGTYTLCVSLTIGIVQICGLIFSILLCQTFRHLDITTP